MGIYPAVDPLASTSRALIPEIVGEEHYDVARQVQSNITKIQRTSRYHCDLRYG